ncbi:MAG: PAS domain-containing protein, partial [Cytophagaceae bacterium]
MDRHLVKISKLPSYARFILENHLDELTLEDLRFAKEIDLPLLKLLAEQTNNQVFEFIKISSGNILLEIAEGKAIEGAIEQNKKFEANQLENIPSERVLLEDVSLTFFVKKQSLFKFIAKYTSDPEEILELVQEIENYYTFKEYLSFKTYTNYNTKKLIQNEEKYRLLAESLEDKNIQLGQTQQQLKEMNLSLEEKVLERTQALQDSETRFRVLTNLVPQMIWIRDKEGFLEYVNDKYISYTGQNRDKILGTYGEFPIHPNDVSKATEIWHKASQTGAMYEVEYRFKNASTGEYRWHITRALPIKDGEGKTVQWFG